jgi:hypothetical protein
VSGTSPSKLLHDLDDGLKEDSRANATKAGRRVGVKRGATMIYEVELEDGTTVQITANTGEVARLLAVTKYKDRVVVSVRRAGLIGMLRRRPELASYHKS